MSKVACQGGCGATEELGIVERIGWSYLEITGAWRCAACDRDLHIAGTLKGIVAKDFIDPLPSDSRGALRKETASSILPTSVHP